MTNEESVVCLVFCDSVKNPITGPKISASYACSPHLNQLTLDVKGATGAVDIAVEGCITTKDNEGHDLADANCTWSNLACIKSDTLNATTNIVENGIYYISVPGINRIRLNCKAVSGNVTVVGTGVR